MERPWSFATNWKVSDGILESCIFLETPISSNETEKDEPEDRTSPIHQVLLSEPPSSESIPCEIEVRLAQRHEIRQVYVRSTARIYEIYLGTETCSNEYLCTVRCGIAANEEFILNDASKTDKAISAQVDGTTEIMEPTEDKIKNDCNGINEDGWVEVKVPGFSSLGSSDTSLTRKIKKTQRIQDFYEATAEIRDSSPCISLTLRLLSLQTKGCIHLEEIYIFAEPVESYDSDPGSAVEKPGGSNLMAMLVPTLLQLSKSGIRKVQDRCISDVRGKESQRHHDDDTKETKSFDPNIGKTTHKEPESSVLIEEGKNVKEANEESAKSTSLESGGPVPGTQQGSDFATKENDLSCSRTEMLLGQLLCRVGRIETFCVGIEENMLKSLNSIDSRLHRLEQHMELLTMRSQSSELYPAIRIAAPEFSCNDSETNSCSNCIKSEFSTRDTCRKDEFLCDASKSNPVLNDENDNHSCGGSESCHKDDTFGESSCNPDASVSLVALQLSAQLVITAPDFSVGDNYSDGDSVRGAGDGPEVDGNESGGNDALEMVKKGCAAEKPSLSLDDALACALAGFLCSASAQLPESCQTSIIEGDYCSSNEDNGNNHRLCSTRTQCDVAADSCTRFGENSMTENFREIESTPCGSTQVNNMQVMNLPNDDTTEAAGVNVVRAGPIWEEGSKGRCLNLSCGTECDIHDAEWKNCDNDSMESMECKAEAMNQSETEEVGDDNSYKISDQAATQKQCVANPTIESGSGAISRMLLEVQNNGGSSKDSIACTDFTSASEAGSSNIEIIENLPKLVFNGVLDFDFPILDVKFDQQKNWNAGSPLLNLLGGIPETIEGDSFAEENNSIVNGEDDSTVPIPSEQLLVEVDEQFVKNFDSNMGNKEIEVPSGCSNQELFLSSSLI